VDAEVYLNEQVSAFINEHFIPIKIHVKERPQDFKRFKAEWTPTVIIAEPDGTERYHFEGFLPADDFIAHLQLGLAKAAFSRGEFDTARREFEAVANEHPESEAAAEALYWAGVSSYKASGKPDPLKQAAVRLREKYSQSEWAKKASVWAA
jgi:hypothetical protein